MLQRFQYTWKFFNEIQFVTEEGLHTLFAIAGRNSQGIGSSVFSTWVKNVEKLDLSEENKKEINEFIDNIYLEMDHRMYFSLRFYFYF